MATESFSVAIFCIFYVGLFSSSRGYNPLCKYYPKKQFYLFIELRSADILKDLENEKTNFFYLGVHLIDLCNSGAYRVYAKGITCGQMRIEYNLPIGAGNLCSEYFFAYCESKFALEKSQVSRLMNIADEFGNKARGFKAQWKDFKYSQLCEFLPLTEEQRKAVKPDWSIKKIREYKKTLVATSQQGEIETPKAETSPNTSKYARFDKWNKRELCDKIFELESERDDLLKEIQTLKSEQNEDSPIPGGLFAKRNLSRGLASLSGGSV